ncbi:hypothetical protein BH23ACT2_BH23ACT2_27760 [soil metagenome]
MKPSSTALMTVMVTWGALVGWGVVAAVVALVAGTLATVAALTHDPLVIRSERRRP